MALLLMSGCSAQPSALLLLPVTGASEDFQVREYPIVEQSTDSPTHASFQQRVQTAVAGQQAGWQFPGQQEVIDAPNRALLPFGYYLDHNPTPPFSGYALYQNEYLIQRDIARFWPVSLKEQRSTGEKTDGNFLLAFETINGEKLVASLDGIRPWPAQSQTSQESAVRTPPVYFGDQVAFAETVGSEVSVYAGSGVLYTASLPVGGSAVSYSNLHTWGQSTTGDQSHWVLEFDGHVIVDGQDFNQTNNYNEVFSWQVVGGKPFFFFTRDGLTHLNYAGRDLLYTYDQVIHGGSGEAALYNPGSSDQLVWFYALRDGLWYYVEAGADP